MGPALAPRHDVSGGQAPAGLGGVDAAPGPATTNLAAALVLDGLRVGVLDADVYGFSIARMLGVRERPEVRQGR
ncbi:MAG: P-loop NTPase, partial [Armatimonadota bacterium]|nr:P-loop NTPase [Armatimonadota bacterium]